MSEALYLSGADLRAIERMKANRDDYEKGMALARISVTHGDPGIRMLAHKRLDLLIGQYLDMEKPVIPADDKPKFVWRNGARVRA